MAGLCLDSSLVLASLGYRQDEYFLSGTASSYGNVNELDSDGYWEVQAAEQADYATRVLVYRPIDAAPDWSMLHTDPIPGFVSCDVPINAGPQHWVLKAGFRGLVNWLVDGQDLPTSPLLEVTDDGMGFELDSFGNALGGIRTPYVDVPVAVLSGLGQAGCAHPLCHRYLHPCGSFFRHD